MNIYITKNAAYSFENRKEFENFEMFIADYEKNKGNDWKRGIDYNVLKVKEFKNSYSAFLDYVNSNSRKSKLLSSAN